MLNTYLSSSYLLYAYCTNSFFHFAKFIISTNNSPHRHNIHFFTKSVICIPNFWSKSSTCSKFYEAISLCISTPNFCGNSSTCNKYQMFTYSTTNYYFLHNFGVRVVLALYFYYSTISYTI